MLKLRRVDIERRKEVDERLNAYVKEVISRLDPEIIMLFGSFARGDINEGSDMDILVVAPFKEGFFERIGTLLRLNTFGIPIEPIGYTPQEFEEMKERGNLFVSEVLRTGKILYRKHSPS